ncbi:MAG: 16S rRNA methyltransferase, partial [Candidatus Helarchaeota archaeon]
MNSPIVIILVEAALEPCRSLSSPSTPRKRRKLEQKRRKSFEETLLDSSIHRHLMQNLPEKEKRGRPDIIHGALLLMLDSRLNKEGMLQIYIHTRANELITFKSEVRIPRNYNRFVGLMEQLFKTRKIPPHVPDPLITLSNKSLRELI